MTPEFKAWPKIPRLNRDCTITEKIDGTNACVIVTEDGEVHAQSRKRIITPESDNFGFAAWVQEHADALRELEPGYHYGEWWGKGIQRGYGLDERRFSLFDVDRWSGGAPLPCHVVPVLWRGSFDLVNGAVDCCLEGLDDAGSLAEDGFKPPEGIVVYHHAARQPFKVLLENDAQPKGLAA